VRAGREPFGCSTIRAIASAVGTNLLSHIRVPAARLPVLRDRDIPLGTGAIVALDDLRPKRFCECHKTACAPKRIGARGELNYSVTIVDSPHAEQIPLVCTDGFDEGRPSTVGKFLPSTCRSPLHATSNDFLLTSRNDRAADLTSSSSPNTVRQCDAGQIP
jgi:hypothetical protein